MPARREELLAGQPPRVRAGQKDRDSRDVSRLPGAAQRSLRGRVLLEVGADEARGVRALGFDDAGVDGVDPDLLRPQLPGEDARDTSRRQPDEFRTVRPPPEWKRSANQRDGRVAIVVAGASAAAS